MTPPAPPPLDSARHPFEQFVLFLGVIVGWPLLLGAPAPGSTTELLGPVLAHVWAWMLVGGCLTALVGSWWTWWAWLSRYWSRWKPRANSALMIERCGLIGLGGGSLVFAFGVLTFVDFDPSRIVGAGLVAGMGFAGFWRAHQIKRWVAWTIALQEAAHGPH
jgi:hypothetical protein